MNDNKFSSSEGPRPDGRPLGRFFDWIRSLKIARPDDRWFAGVCSAIAGRTGIDPILVRGIVVVATLLGAPMVTFYFVAWALIPDRHGEIHVERLFAGRGSGTSWTVSIIALVLLVSGTWGGASWVSPMGIFVGWGHAVTWVLTVALIAVVALALVRWSSEANGSGSSGSTGQDTGGSGAQRARSDAPGSGTGRGGADARAAFTTPHDPAAPHGSTAGSMGAASTAVASRPRMPGVGAAGGLLILGALLVVGAGAALVAPFGVREHPWLVAFLAMLLALGAITIAVSLAGRRVAAWSGWIGVVLIVVLSTAVVGGKAASSVAFVQNSVTSSSQLADGSSSPTTTVIGNQTIDLTKSNDATMALRGRTIHITGGVGNVRLIIPSNVLVTVNAQLGAGNLETALSNSGNDVQSSGIWHTETVRIQYGQVVDNYTSGNANEAITINVRHAIGDVKLEMR